MLTEKIKTIDGMKKYPLIIRTHKRIVVTCLTKVPYFLHRISNSILKRGRLENKIISHMKRPTKLTKDENYCYLSQLCWP